MAQSLVAEFRFPKYGYETTGHIAQMDREQLQVCFTTLAIAERLTLPTQVETFFLIKGVLRVLGTDMVHLQGQTGNLKITEPIRQLHARQDTRFPACINLEFRTARGNTFTSIWHTAVCHDLSLGGLCFTLPSHIAPPTRIDLAFNLTDLWMQTIWQKHSEERNVHSIDLEAELKPFRTQGRVCHVRTTPEGNTYVGIQFVSLEAGEKLRLARVLHDIFG
jgi:hypothetical protein